MTSASLQENWTSLSAETICSSQILGSGWPLSKQIIKVIDRELVKLSDVLCILILLWISWLS